MYFFVFLVRWERLSSFGFLGLDLSVSKNQMCLMCGGFSMAYNGLQLKEVAVLEH